MKRARQWADEIFGCDCGTADIDDVRRIQADALRWAANISGVLQNVTILERAEILDRLASGEATMEDRVAESKI